MSGFVSFVSAGPGDPELLTLKGAARLKAADVVLYDDLAAGEILSHAHEHATLVSVGKRAGRPSAKQQHVNQLLLDYANRGAKVVRLKSGDAGIFGRLEEEVTALRSAGIAYEIIPGVTSGSAAAAAALIPLTRRETSRRIQCVTGSDITGDLPSDLNWQALADPKATTMVYMGRRTFPALAERIMQEGLPADTPALLGEALGTTQQRLIHTTVQQLGDALTREERQRITTVILYGPLALED